MFEPVLRYPLYAPLLCQFRRAALLPPPTAPAAGGDYSAAALDPNGKDLWMATEYVPSGFTDPIINYGTRVFDVA